MASEPIATGSQRAPDVRVFLAEDGGWTIHVEREGQVVAIERYDDWHRVERRVAMLTTEISSRRHRLVAVQAEIGLVK